MISLSAPMCVPSNTVPSSKIKNAFILSSHSAAFATFVFLSVAYDTCELLRWVSAMSTIPTNCYAGYLQCLRYLRIAPLGICNVYDTYELLRCFAALAILKTFGFHCILMFWRFKPAPASPCKHGRPLPFKSGICIIDLLYHKKNCVAIDPVCVKTYKKQFRNPDTPWII